MKALPMVEPMAMASETETGHSRDSWSVHQTDWSKDAQLAPMSLVKPLWAQLSSEHSSDPQWVEQKDAPWDRQKET